MGYTTHFDGKFETDREVDQETYDLLTGLNDSRRMKRKGLDPKYGVDGEFFCGADGFKGQDRDESIVDYNSPPSTQPGLWCQWEIQEDRRTIEWDGGEKFYEYVAWIEYLIDRVLAPKGYIVNGQVKWNGENSDDQGVIKVKDNVVKVGRAKITFEFDDGEDE